MELRVQTIITVLAMGLVTGCLQTPTTTTIGRSAGSGVSNITRFAEGTKAVKIVLSDTSGIGSFSAPPAVPTATPIPSPFPGNNGSAFYLPGVSASTYFDVDGVTPISKPSWLLDFQVGITSTSASSACATFGGSGAGDVSDYYRVSEVDCGSVSNGVGSGTDPVFLRLILDRDTNQIGASENLMLQVEYQASALRLNSDGVSSNPELNVDQLWKVFWSNTLAFGTSFSPFSVFVPPNGAACVEGGTGAGAGCSGNSTGAPIVTKQIMIPLSAYPDRSVIQITRMKGRINDVGNYVSSFCTTSDSPLCLGVVFRSIMLMRL